jgi:hypothetical protein
MSITNSRPNDVRHSERRLSVVMALVFLPWIVVVLLTAGGWAALNFLGYAIMMLAAGYAIISLAVPTLSRAKIFLLAPAVGILVNSALTVFWLRLRLPLAWVPAIWAGLMVAGAWCLWRDRDLWKNRTVAFGWTLVVLSVLICAILFLPGARKDAALRSDGSFNWIYADTQYNYSVAAAIMNGDRPPNVPGTATEELAYHFGGYAPAAVISNLDGLDLGHAYARVTRGASFWALVLSCFELGTLLSLKANGEKFGGIMSVAGLFFYGSLLSLFTDERNSSSHVTGAILFKIPKIDVLGDGGPFSHLILGHSMLHGLLAITAIMALCLAQREIGAGTSRTLALIALPAFAIAMDSVAALYCIGVVCILLFWEHLGAARSWLMIALLFGLFLAVWKLMGFGHSPDVAITTINRYPGSYWWTIVVWFMVGLGFRIVGFRWITRQLSDPMSILVLASVVGLLSFNVLFQFAHGEERYGMYFLQSMFSIFAFSQLSFGFWRGADRSKWIGEWLGLAMRGLILLISCAVLLRISIRVFHIEAPTVSFSRQILPLCVFVLILVGMAALMRRSRNISVIASSILMSVLMIGFLAWITPWLNFGMGRMKMDITATPGEVQGLRRLGELAAPGERFATNKHVVDSLAALPARSYAYDSLSERPVLIEGYEYKGVTALPWFNAMLRDNDLMFTTTDAEKVRTIAQTWHVRWLVARPDTDIALARPLPPWLVEQQNSGSLKIYRVD